ncbi:DUF2127 domain-containing protein [Bryocella elongata]|nr:DUF2127 domain-containing protein [Bryocella elongata]
MPTLQLKTMTSVPEPMSHAAPAPHSVDVHPHRQGLWLVGIFKLCKVIFFTAVGVGALNLLHKDLGDLAARLVSWAHDYAHLDAEGNFASFLMERSELITHHQLRRGALFAFLYAGLCLVEAVGLLMEKRWAEYFTVTLTALALPWETYELVDRFAWYKVGLTLVNIVVLLYLLWVLKKKGITEGENSE